MVDLNRRDHNNAADLYLRCTALSIPLPEDAVELVVSVRLSHHLEEVSDREAHLRELFRVAKRAVIVTWFSESSLKNRLRQLRAPFNKKQPKKTLSNVRVREIATECGFKPEQSVPLARLSSGHVFGLFVRR